jgi:uncharacterized membrane protein
VSYTELMDGVARGFEIGGVLVLVAGFAWALLRAARLVRPSDEGTGRFTALRRMFERSILLSLEILVAADLIRTVAVQPTLQNVIVLGLIILIRTFLSFSLEIEIEGVPPWRRAALRAALPGGWARRPSNEMGPEGS